MVASLDGFIAKKDESIQWMYSQDKYEKGEKLSPGAIAEFLKKIDCYLMGSKTYERALEIGWPYGDTPVLVLTDRKLTSNNNSVEFYSGDIFNLVNDHLKPKYKNVWLVGGAMVTKEFLLQNLADEIVISILPIILGDGLPFFDYIGKEQPLHLKDVNTYHDGMVELNYEIKKNQ